MKKLILILVILGTYLTSFGQTFGYAFSTPKEALTYLNDSEKHLLLDCAKLMGVELDSMQSVDDIYDKPEFINCNIKVVVRSNYLFVSGSTKELTMTVIETVKKTITLDKPRFMIFVLRNEGRTKITLQMYY